MYIEKYINDFNDDMYKYYLSDLQKLKQLADAYASQYNNPTYDCTIAFKESLDHYICREFSKNPNIINTTEFKNYLQYINYIFAKRVGNNNSQLEYNTNVVLQNNELKNTILSFYDQDTRKKIEIIIDKNSLAMDEIINKLDNNLSLNQNEADIFSDYLYTRRNLEDRNYIKFIDYILNNKDNLKTSPQIIAAYIAYLPKIYGNGCEYSRAILSNGIAKSNDINTILPNEIDMYRGQKKLRNYGFYSHGDQYISMGWDLLKNLNLYGNKSLDISRTMAGNGKYDTLEEKEEAKEYNDLYWISMTTFHEMTHQLQNNSMKSREFNSSGLAQLIKITKKNDTDNTLNHDSIESEIEADVETLMYVMKNYKYNWDNEHFIASNHKLVLDIQRTARKNMNGYKKKVSEVVKSKQLVVAQAKVNSSLADLEKRFKYYRLSLYTFSMASMLEIMLGGNFKEEYIIGIKDEISGLADQYRELFSQCSIYLEKMSHFSVEAYVLKGIGKAGKAVGKFVGKIPVVKEGPVDEFLRDSGAKLKDNAIGMQEKAVRAFAECGNPGTRVFTEKMEDMIQIYNHTSKICFDNGKIYLIAN